MEGLQRLERGEAPLMDLPVVGGGDLDDPAIETSGSVSSPGFRYASYWWRTWSAIRFRYGDSAMISALQLAMSSLVYPFLMIWGSLRLTLPMSCISPAYSTSST
jgi:hypothetical protein